MNVLHYIFKIAKKMNLFKAASYLLDKLIWPSIIPQYKGKAGMVNYDLETLLFFRLVQNQKTYLHAGGVSIDDKGTIIFGHPNVGKTSLILELCKKGCSFLGDDLVILTDNGFVTSYPKFIQVEGLFLRENPEIFSKMRNNLGFKEPLILNYMLKIYSNQLDKIGILQKITDIVENVKLEKKCKVKNLIHLVRSPRKSIEIIRLSPSILLQKLRLQLFYEFCDRYIYKGYIYAMQQNQEIKQKIFVLWRNIKKIIGSIKDSACYEIIIPQSVKMDKVAEKILGIMDNAE